MIQNTIQTQKKKHHQIKLWSIVINRVQWKTKNTIKLIIEAEED